MTGIALVWFRNDLRLADNPALQAAVRAGLMPLPVYVHAPEEEGPWPPGAASDAWRHHSLGALDAELRCRGSRLHICTGPTAVTLPALAAATGAEAVFWNRRYDPAIEDRDGRIKRDLRRVGLRVESCNGSLLAEPWQVQTKVGGPYRVFTPFWRAASEQLSLPGIVDGPAELPTPPAAPGCVALDSLGLAASRGWDRAFWAEWTPGEAGASAALAEFMSNAIEDYPQARDRPDRRATSRLSPHLHFGELAPWRIVHALRDGAATPSAEAFLRQLGWREFAHHVLHHFPATPGQNFNPRFDGFKWIDVAQRDLDAWRRGRTGVPIVDAGMRELWATGWMHNRVRMIAASFLTKNLRAHWSVGARWFWDTLVDADLANNTLGWQWVAGTGVDAAPYFRVFNPVSQSRRFDPDGEYLARWIPELARLPVAARHAPWSAIGVRTEELDGYPLRPIVDLAATRRAALQGYRELSST